MLFLILTVLCIPFSLALNNELLLSFLSAQAHTELQLYIFIYLWILEANFTEYPRIIFDQIAEIF